MCNDSNCYIIYYCYYIRLDTRSYSCPTSVRMNIHSTASLLGLNKSQSTRSSRRSEGSECTELYNMTSQFLTGLELADLVVRQWLQYPSLLFYSFANLLPATLAKNL